MNLAKENGMKSALVFVGIAVLIHAAVYYDASRKSFDPWLYTSVQGVQIRTDRHTGIRYFSGPSGWVTAEQRQAEMDEQRKKIEESYSNRSGFSR